jgi:hypothetical protein
MYYLDGTGLGQYTPWRQRVGVTPKPPQLLRFLSLDDFGIDKWALTPDHVSKIKNILVPTVEASWKTMQAIDLIRLVGHTDNSGEDKHNLGLGDRRAGAVANELLKFFPLNGKVKVVIDESQGERQPTADNRTAEGRKRNRRVEVFIVANTRSIPEPPPPPPPCLRPPCIELPPEPIIKVDPGPWWVDIPSAPPGKSVRDWLIEVCSPAFGKACPGMVDQVLKGACWVLEQIISGAGATLSQKQKEELRQRCRDAAAGKSLR